MNIRGPLIQNDARLMFWIRTEADVEVWATKHSLPRREFHVHDTALPLGPMLGTKSSSIFHVYYSLLGME